MKKDKYYIQVTFAGEVIRREVTMEEFCQHERDAGFRTNFPGRPATGGFSAGAISGIVEYSQE